MEKLFQIQWDPFPASISNKEGTKLFIQSFLMPFGGTHLTESEQHHLWVCMLLSIPSKPVDIMRNKASLRDNLALYSVTDMIGIVIDLAQDNTYIGEVIQVNRWVVAGKLIPELAQVTSVPSCTQCLHPQPRCVCGGWTLPTSFTSAVTTPLVYTTPVTQMQPLQQGADYGVGSTPSPYCMGPDLQPTLASPQQVCLQGNRLQPSLTLPTWRLLFLPQIQPSGGWHHHEVINISSLKHLRVLLPLGRLHQLDPPCLMCNRSSLPRFPSVQLYNMHHHRLMPYLVEDKGSSNCWRMHP